MLLLQVLVVLAGAFWIIAGAVLLPRAGVARRALGVVAIAVGTVVLVLVALWILADAPLSAPGPRAPRFPPLP